ncbi:hypothetical protein NUU61_004427 [Penicillium alfredii]|uniref:Uncharacterized protein n=1 Tax=Penicillium alfredii TaxID=1506179 RepID=A0A9W9FL66_9EURO|nr:uncharacterized protein NUU61_004427 [Penicillium alfredii]KAJ5102205.1 hypothetical protein NUU61_004427 [Penicillium alfredii]
MADTDKIRCIVTPTDVMDPDMIAAVEAYLKDITQQPAIYSYVSRPQNIFKWWVVHLTSSQIEEVQNHKDIAYAAPSMPMMPN